jgi:hypothetical protein
MAMTGWGEGRRMQVVSMSMPNTEWHWEQGTKYAIEGIKALLAINGGAAVALLAFAGNLTKGGREPAAVASSLGVSLMCFGGGALAAAVAFIFAYVKNHNLHFEVPYQFGGDTHRYRPDYIVRLMNGDREPLNLVVEIKGFRDDADAAKADTMKKMWVPAVNNAKTFGRWDFMEFTEAPYDVDKAIRARLRAGVTV